MHVFAFASLPVLKTDLPDVRSGGVEEHIQCSCRLRFEVFQIARKESSFERYESTKVVGHNDRPMSAYVPTRQFPQTNELRDEPFLSR